MLFRHRILIACLTLAVPVMLWALTKGDPVKGKETFKRCAVCHGDSGEGRAAIAKAYGVQMPHLGSAAVQSLDDAAVRKIIVEGKGKMQPVNLSQQELADVIAFLRTLKKP